MIQYEGMKTQESRGASYMMLPAGAYVAGIRAVKIDGAAPDQTLIIRLDIIEGEWAGYYTKRYEAEAARAGARFPAKYKGDLRLRIPHPQSTSKYPDSDRSRFEDAMWRVEKSNPGWHWDGNENGLVGKVVGLSVQEGTYNDSPYTFPARLETADDVRQGLVKVMKPRKPSYSEGWISAGNPLGGGSVPPGFTPVEEEDIPF